MFWLTAAAMIVTTKEELKEIRCIECNVLNEYVSKGNQTNGTYICYGCRN